MSFIKSFDMCCLTETFIDYDFQSDKFSDYTFITSPAKKLSHRGRKSGGVIVCFRTKFSPYVNQVEVNCDNTVVVRIDKSLFSISKDIFLVGMYVPPCESAAHGMTENGFGIESLEQCVMDLQESFDDFHLIVCGDLNARTSNNNGVAEISTDPLYSDAEEILHHRVSQDCVSNVFGNQLIDFCSMFDCSIVNGLCEREFDDGFTYISNSGSSVIDYFITSNDLLTNDFVSGFEITSRVESTHLPVSLTVRSIKLDEKEPTYNENAQWSQKIVWDSAKEHEFLSFLLRQDVIEEICGASNDIDTDTDTALERFVNCLLSAASCMKRQVRVGVSNQKEAAWFDKDCYEAKKKARQLLRALRRTNLKRDEKLSHEKARELFVQARKEYRQLIKSKKSASKREKAFKLHSSMKDPKVFWKEIRTGFGKPKSKVSDKISIGEWFEHFKNVYQSSEAEENWSEAENYGENEILNELNVPITDEEVQTAILSLKNAKAAGCDDVLAEMLKASGMITVTFLTKLFNTIFEKGAYPEQWSRP